MTYIENKSDLFHPDLDAYHYSIIIAGLFLPISLLILLFIWIIELIFDQMN